MESTQIDLFIVCKCECVNVPAYRPVSQEALPASLCHTTGACQVLACVSMRVCERVKERFISAKRRACELCRPLSFLWVCACQAVWVCVHSGVHVYDWGKGRSCQVRLWPHKATEGHGSSAFLSWVQQSLVWMELQPITGWALGHGNGAANR